LQVALPDQTNTDGRTAFEQLCYNGLWLQLGQAAYVHSADKDHPDIVRIDRLWRGQKSVSLVMKPPHLLNNPFYNNLGQRF
jgi:hypothetical protein